jgi:mannose-6-phosphate isomerase-like protein (cupin superfamily)
MKDSRTIRLDRTFVQIDDGPAARAVPVDDRFWQRIGERTSLHPGRLVMLLHYSEDWPTWEMHPEGEEIVYCVKGGFELILDEDGSHRRLALKAGEACIVPRGVWHTAGVRRPSDALHITRGAGTRNRPRPSPGSGRAPSARESRAE